MRKYEIAAFAMFACVVELFFCGGAYASDRSVNGVKYYEAFLQYRKALSNESVNCSPYFSVKLNETWVGSLLVLQPGTDLLRRLHAFRNRYRFGDSVKEVYAYSATPAGTGRVNLTVIYRDSVDRRVETLQITYIVERGKERIAALLFDSRAPQNFHGGPPVASFGGN